MKEIPQIPQRPKPKIFSISEEVAERGLRFADKILDKVEQAKIVLIKKKGRVVAKARWKNGSLIVHRIRRPNSTKLKTEHVIHKRYEPPPPVPPRPELKTEGHQLIRNLDYSSKKAVREDPFWKNYVGWFIIPQTINGESGLINFLEEYPELKENNLGSGDEKYTVQNIDDIDKSKLKMALFSEVDAYVCGWTEKIPELIPYSPPKSTDMVTIRAKTCFCGCGRFEDWYKHWNNTWIVYVPRETPE